MRVWRRTTRTVRARLLTGLLTGLLAGLLALLPAYGASAALVERSDPAAGPDRGVPERAPSNFVALDEVDPSILHDIRYTTPHNFVGRRINAYRDSICVLTRPAAQALAEAQQHFLALGYSLKVYDCYRPQSAVNDFVRWAERLHDNRMKQEFYPEVVKSDLFADGYIAEESGHSRGSTVDLTLVELPARPQPRWHEDMGLVPCFASYDERFPDNTIDMGTGFDCFDPLSHTLNPQIQGEARENRLLLKEGLEQAGFTNYPNEWWHYTLDGEPYTDTYFDFPVDRRVLGRLGQ